MSIHLNCNQSSLFNLDVDWTVKCQTPACIKNETITLDPRTPNFFNVLVELLQKQYGFSLIQNSYITISGKYICVSSKYGLKGGNLKVVKASSQANNELAWQDGPHRFTLRLQGGWCELFGPKEEPEVRETMRQRVLNIPFASTLSFSPSDTDLIMRFYIPASDKSNCFINNVRDFLQGIQTKKEISFASMKIDPRIFQRPLELDSISLRNFLSLGGSNDPFFNKIKTVLKVENLCLYHFFSKNITQQGRIALQREIQAKGVLSKAQCARIPLLDSLPLGISIPKDEERNDHHYVHCYLGFPSIYNLERCQSRLPLQLNPNTPLEMAFTQKEGVVILPYDQMEVKPFNFLFLSEIYNVNVDKDTYKLTYFRWNDRLYSHHFTDEIFNNPEGLFLLFSKIVRTFDFDFQKRLFEDEGHLLKELFNDFFAFRSQISFPEKLEYIDYSHVEKVKLTELVSLKTASVPDLKKCYQRFKDRQQSLPADYILSTGARDSIKKIVDFFKYAHCDYAQNYNSLFAFLGGISSGLALHFEPQICNEFTSELLDAIIYLNNIGHPAIDIMKSQNSKVTLFSLIEHSLKFDFIQMRIPPNKSFNTPTGFAEKNYVNQLLSFYENGSPLLNALGGPCPRIAFDQRRYSTEVLCDGIKFLCSPVNFEVGAFANLHNFNVSQFNYEFERGLEKYFCETELIQNKIVQKELVPFVESLLDGASLLTPRFKHDLLDIKHFQAGLLNQTKRHFLDGSFTFADIMLTCLTTLLRQILLNEKPLSVNGQLIIDTMRLCNRWHREQPPLD